MKNTFVIAIIGVAVLFVSCVLDGLGVSTAQDVGTVQAVITQDFGGQVQVAPAPVVNNVLAFDGTKWNASTVGAVVGTLGVANGGTGRTSFTVHGVLIGEVAAALGVTGAGTSGQALTSNGPNADPTFQTIPTPTWGQVLGSSSASAGNNPTLTAGDVVVFNDSSAAAVSGLAQGSLRYNNTTAAFETSVQGGAWGALSTANSFQTLYNTGPNSTSAQITLSTTKGPVALVKPAAMAGPALTINDQVGATDVALQLTSGTITVPGLGTTSEAFGSGATTSGATNGTAVGRNASVGGSNQVALGVGASCSTAGSAIAIGQGASCSNNGDQAIGGSATASGGNAFAFGNSASASGGHAFAFGTSSTASVAYSMAFGMSSSATHKSIVFGDSLADTADGQFLVGSVNVPISTVLFGNGVTAAAPPAVSWTLTSASGLNVAGSTLSINGSQGTGTGAGGQIIFKTAPAGASSSALNPLVTAVTVAATGGVQVGAPTGGDKGAGTLNATNLYINGVVVSTATPTLGQVVNAGNVVNSVAVSGRLTWAAGGIYSTGASAEVVGPSDNNLFVAAGATQGLNLYGGANGGGALLSGGNSSGANSGTGGTGISTGSSTGNATPNLCYVSCSPAVAGGASGSGTNSAVNIQTWTANQNQLSGTNNISVLGQITFADAGVTSAGTDRTFYINPTYNYTAASRAVANTDLQIDRVETSLGTGAQNFLLLRAGAAGTTTKFQIDNTGAVTQAAKTINYNNVATVAWGVPAVYGTGRTTGATGAVASVAVYTVGAADGSFLISGNILITAFTAGTISMTCAYTDEGGTARTLTLNFENVAGTITTTPGAAGAFEGFTNHIRAKASTSITIATTAAAFTGTYNVEGYITQIG